MRVVRRVLDGGTASFLFAVLLGGLLANAASAAPPAGEPVLKVGSIRPVPPDFAGSASELEPLAVGWRWTRRIVGSNTAIRTTIEAGEPSELSGRSEVARIWHQRVELIAPGEPVRGGVVILVARQKSSSVVALGQLADGRENQKGEVWDPPRLLLPASVHAGTAWSSAGARHRVAGVADVRVGKRRYPMCVVIEEFGASGTASARRYLARGVGEVVTERRVEGTTAWRAATVLEQWAKPGSDAPPESRKVRP